MDLEQQNIHREIADLAQVQDRALVNRRALKEKLRQLPEDDSDKRPELEKGIDDLGRQAQDAEETLGGFFDKQDELTHRTEKAQHETEQVNDDIYELKHELDAIHHWSNSRKKPAVIKVSGTVVQGTFISGPHTRTVLKENARHVTIREVKNTDPDSTAEYEIKLQHS